MSKVFLLIFFRIVNALLTQTFFQPDEFWQSLEVAHKIAFGFGYLTWEWHQGLRSVAYPLIFAILYKLLEFFHLDSTWILILAPKLIQAIFAAFTDYFTFKLGRRVLGQKNDDLILICSLLSWYNFLSSTRTFSNSIEATFTIAALYYWPDPSVDNVTLALTLAAVSCVLRPTNALIWLFVGTRYILTTSKPFKVFLTAFTVMSLAFAFMLFSDYRFYGKVIFVPFQFISINVFESISEFYGMHAWHWYITQGFPILLGPLLPFAIYGAWKQTARMKPYGNIIIFVVAIYSLLKHKEGRFLHPILPLLLLYPAHGLSMIKTKWPNWYKRSIIFLVIANIGPAFYANLIHQRGVMSVVEFIRTNNEITSVGFLMPCHSTPWQSHIHRNDLEMWFLTCEPPLHKDPLTYLDEADIFYSDPVAYLKTMKRTWPSNFVMFESLIPYIDKHIREEGYVETRRFFNSHWHDDVRRRGDVVIYSKETTR